MISKIQWSAEHKILRHPLAKDRREEIILVRKVRVGSMMFSEYDNVTESGEVFNWGL